MASFACHVPRRRFIAASLPRFALCLLLLGSLSLGVAQVGVAAPAAPAGVPTLNPALLPQIEAATFEVVAAKPKDTLKYAQPLPLDLLPYQERTDKYYSIGTAFAIGPNEFVTAGHVIMTGNQSLWGPPELRDAKGKVYAIDQVLKFALRRDFVVFSLKDPPTVTPLATDVHPTVNEAVYSVGNAEGTGVVIRNGLYTSNTPENQSGAWNWIRFSAPASPGNSGGPLLNQQGQVIGVVLMKSPSETLNYALPISQVLDAPEDLARYDKRTTWKLPVSSHVDTAAFKGSFALPKSLAEFFASYQQATNAFAVAQVAATTAAQSRTLFPRGRGSERILNGNAPPRAFPQILHRSGDGIWVASGKPDKRVPLGDNGYVTLAQLGEIGLLHLRKPDDAAFPGFYRNAEGVMDLLLKTGFLHRKVGNQEIRITSLRAPSLDEPFTDTWGRPWQVWAWPVPFANHYVLMLALPQPDGYAVISLGTPSPGELTRVVGAAKELSNFVSVSYLGTLAEWQQFLQEPSLLPAAFRHIHITYDYGKNFRYDSPRISLSIAAATQKISPESMLWLGFDFLPPDASGKVAWGVTEMNLAQDNHDHHWIGFDREQDPPPNLGDAFQSVWKEMTAHQHPYDGKPFERSGATWIASVVPPPHAGKPSVLYAIRMSRPGSQSQADMQQKLTAVLKGVQVKEQ